MPSTHKPPLRRENATLPKNVHVPVLRVTRYDRVSAVMIALMMGIVLAAIYSYLQYLSNRRPADPPLIALDMIDTGGGFEDGNPEDSPQVDSPDEVDPNATPVDEVVEDQQVTETLETVVELSERATKQVQEVLASDSEAGVAGSAVGTGGRPLGSGGGPGKGIGIGQRWFIRFNETSITEYAKQLDFFEIELGIYYPATSKMTYISKISGSPVIRQANEWKDDRWYFKWGGGARENVDRELFKKAGVNTSGGQIFHFYPNLTLQKLLTIELNYANKKPEEIRRTYFSVDTQGSGYVFKVTNQTYLR
ncbi:MAG: hypothetical protein R3C01_10750 [Planctomycetaceae bacterium]